MINIEAEQYLLGCILSEPNILSDIIVTKEHFYDQRHQQIYDSIKRLQAKDEHIGIVSVVTELGDKGLSLVEYITNLAGMIATVEPYKQYEKYVIESWKIREAYQLLESTKEELAATNDIQKISQLTTKLQAIDELGITKEYNIMHQLVLLQEEFDKEHKGLTGIGTGFTDLDFLTDGLQDSELIILASPPSVGKTAFAVNIAKNAGLRKHVVVIFSLEMIEKALLKRFVSLVGKIDGMKLKNPRQYFKSEDWDNTRESMAKISNMNLYIYDSIYTIPEMRSTLYSIKKKHKDKKILVVIDYLQKIRGTNPKLSRNEEVSEISWSLKKMAKDFNVPVLTISSLRRGVEGRQDKRPINADLRDSGNIEFDADVIMFLYREDYYDKQSDKQNIAELIISKQRNGPTGTIELYFNKQYNEFQNLSK